MIEITQQNKQQEIGLSLSTSQCFSETNVAELQREAVWEEAFQTG